jgi:hypothetical protein
MILAGSAASSEMEDAEDDDDEAVVDQECRNMLIALAMLKMLGALPSDTVAGAGVGSIKVNSDMDV